MEPIPGYHYLTSDREWVFVPGIFHMFKKQPYRIVANMGTSLGDTVTPADRDGLNVQVGISPQMAEWFLAEFGRDPKSFAEAVHRTVTNLLKWAFTNDVDRVYRIGTTSPGGAGSLVYLVFEHSAHNSEPRLSCCKGSCTSEQTETTSDSYRR